MRLQAQDRQEAAPPGAEKACNQSSLRASEGTSPAHPYFRPKLRESLPAGFSVSSPTPCRPRNLTHGALPFKSGICRPQPGRWDGVKGFSCRRVLMR